jgi:hypothetical protein
MGPLNNQLPAPVDSMPGDQPAGNAEMLLNALMERFMSGGQGQQLTPADFVQELQAQGMIGDRRTGIRSDGRRRKVNIESAPREGSWRDVSTGGSGPPGGATPSSHGLTPQADWDAMFPSAPQRAAREAERQGIPVEMTMTQREIDSRNQTANERMNENLGIRPDMSLEQKQQAVASATAARTGNPIEMYLPQWEPTVTQFPDGRREVHNQGGMTVGSVDPNRQQVKDGLINGQPSSNYGKGPAPQPFDQAEFIRKYPDMHKKITDQVNKSFGL